MVPQPVGGPDTDPLAAGHRSMPCTLKSPSYREGEPWESLPLRSPPARLWHLTAGALQGRNWGSLVVTQLVKVTPVQGWPAPGQGYMCHSTRTML